MARSYNDMVSCLEKLTVLLDCEDAHSYIKDGHLVFEFRINGVFNPRKVLDIIGDLGILVSFSTFYTKILIYDSPIHIDGYDSLSDL